MGFSDAGATPDLYIRYTFIFQDGRKKVLELRLDHQTLKLRPPAHSAVPAWAQLSFCQCPNCPLREPAHPHCPVAANLAEPVEAFKDSESFEEVDVEVETKDRKYVKHTSLQRGISSLLGVIMATSGCPILSKLRPMVDTHLPFMNPEETTYRVLSMYLMGQYFAYRRGREADWELKQLLALFEEVRQVNSSFCERLRSVHIKDASINAVTILNTLADLTSLSIEDGQLDRLEGLFRASECEGS
ncbi:MAG: hypothetical protein HYU36_05835 [Planctomycetes bacterium]|nr:hypothetical protein [Planctomycetota bacterium]